MYGFFTSPPGSPKSRARRLSSLPSAHNDYKLGASFATPHRQHRPSSAFLSISSLLALANLPDSKHSRRRVGRIALFLGSLFVIAYVLVSRWSEPRWMQNLSSKPHLGPAPLTRSQLAARAIYGGDEEWHTMMAAAPLQNIVAARPATSIVMPDSAPLSPAEELAGLVHFITSTYQGILPPAAFEAYTPATTPLHADWVLDFEPGPLGEARDRAMRSFQEEVWSDARFVMFGRQRADGFLFGETVKLLHNSYLLNTNEFQMIDIEAREDSEILEPILMRLVPSHTLPAVFIRGTHLGSLAEVRALHEADLLKPMLDAAQLRFDKPKVKRRPVRYVQRDD